MEDTEEEEMHDTDRCDFGNSLAVVEYVDEIYSFYRMTEVIICLEPRSSYLVQSCVPELTWRTHPMQIYYKLELLGEILFLTVNIIDRYLARENVARKKLLL